MRCVLIPIVTGTAPSEVQSIEETIAATNYQPFTIYLPPLSHDVAMQLVSNAGKYYALQRSSPDPLIKERFIDQKNPLFSDLVRFAVPFPQYAQFLGNVLVGSGSPLELNSLDHLSIVWREVYQLATQQYRKENWDASFPPQLNPVNIILRSIQIAYFKSPVQRESVIEGISIAVLEKAGFIFLSPHPQQHFTINMAPIILHHLDQSYHLKLFDEVIFQRFGRLDENTFPRYILAIHAATYKLLTLDGPTQVSRGQIYQGAAEGADSSLNETITIHPGVDIRDASSTYQPKYHINRSNVRQAALVAEAMPSRVELVDLLDTSHPHLVLNTPRAPSSDALTPHGDEQYKFSLYMASGQPIPEEAAKSTKFITQKLLLEEWNKRTGDKFALISPKSLDESLSTVVKNLPQGILLVCGKQLKEFMGVFFTEAAYREN